MNRSRGFI